MFKSVLHVFSVNIVAFGDYYANAVRLILKLSESLS